MKASAPRLCRWEKGIEEETGAGVMSARMWRADCCARGGVHVCEECWAENARGRCVLGNDTGSAPGGAELKKQRINEWARACLSAVH